MKVWNRKHKPKHWTKPKWKSRTLETSLIKIYHLVSRGMKNKYEFDAFFNFMTNKPKFEILSTNKIRSNNG